METVAIRQPDSPSQEEFVDTKGVIRIHKLKERQHKCQMKKNKRTNNDLQNTHNIKDRVTLN
jgi:hypothetical protein